MIKKYVKTLFFIFFVAYNSFAQNNAPIIQNDFDTADINTTLNVTAPGLLGNDSDPDGDALTIVQFIVNGTVYNVGQVANFAQGSIIVNADGSFTFIPTPGYTGDVTVITYIVSDGTTTSSANLFLTVEHITDLLEISYISSCNQGYTANGEYEIKYDIRLTNLSTARDYHSPSIISNISLTDDLESVFGNGCIISIDQLNVSTTQTIDYINNPYPLEWNNTSINSNFESITSTNLFNTNATNTNVLYPRQSIDISFCVVVSPFCNGRPNPTPSGSGINFDNILNVTSAIGNDTSNLLITDFHSSEAVVAGNLFIPETSPEVNFDGTYDYTNTVKLTNEGTSIANNINYNLGLGSFLDNGITFNSIVISQVSGPAVTINNSYNGDDETKLLLPNNSLAQGETVVLEIFHLIGTISSTNENYFTQLSPSLTQGNLDGYDETLSQNLRINSFIIWSDGLGDHLDRYYAATSISETPTSNNQCACSNAPMVFTFTSSSTNIKTITSTNDTPNEILEHQEVTFQLTATNTSTAVQLENIQLQDNLNSVCSGNIISVSNPTIVSSTANTNPTLNPLFDGTSNFNIFNGTSGILEPNQSITVEFIVNFYEDCIGINTSDFTATDPLNNVVISGGAVNVSNFTDIDSDGISNIDDIDDDNDTVPDTVEYNGLNPIGDDDGDFIPNYRDLDFGTDSNSDGIIDLFDFDLDGVPNHFDLDSDNDVILDIVEVGNSTLDTSNNGETNNTVGLNGLDDSIEDNDSPLAIITYTIPNTDSSGNQNYLDIDSDGDGIVDNIEVQPTDSYIAPNGTVSITGIDTAYTNGITPVDTDSDTVFDYVDLNSDSDIRDDFIEGWDFNNDGTPETIALNLDSDNDGLDNAFDTDDSQINPSNSQVPTDFPNVDNSATMERDWREIIAVVVVINNVSVIEGGDLVFTVSITTMNDNSILVQSATPIDIDLSTSDGTTATTQYEIAMTPFDYNQVLTTTLIIPPYTSTESFTVTTLDDNIFELDEQLTLNGIITSNNTINTYENGIGTIIDNELPPTITMNDSREDEGVDLVHTIILSHPSSTPTDINISTTDDTAINPLDYIGLSDSYTIDGTIDPNNTNTEVQFSITTNIDNLNEPDEEYINVDGIVTSNNVGNQDLNKTGTIVDIDPDPTIVIDDQTVVEGNTMTFTISLLNANDEPMQNYQAIDLDLTTNNVSANSPDDYTAINTSTIIPAFTEFIIQEITTIDDELNEDTETMELQVTVTSSNISNASPVIIGIGTIKDNDIPNLFSPNGDGMSDVFEISGIEDFPEFKIQIYDRWGSEVYNYNNNGNTNPNWWNGTYKDKPVPEGVYYYTLDFNDGITKPKVSFIELIR
jgi:gliding motility-associated-like protein